MWDKPLLLIWLADLLYAVAAILLLYSLLFLVIHLPLFPLREVEVTGQLSHLTRAQVRYVVSQTLKGNFFTLDLDQARNAFEKLPWVRSATLRRRWPDRLEVSLKEHVALARWGNMGLVDTDGDVFQAASNRELPVFIGQAGDAGLIAKHYEVFKKLLAPLGLAPAQIVLSPRRAWELRLSNGMLVELGREQTDARLAKFVSVYDQTIAKLPATPKYVDLRYPNGFAVRWPSVAGGTVGTRGRA